MIENNVIKLMKITFGKTIMRPFFFDLHFLFSTLVMN